MAEEEALLGSDAEMMEGGSSEFDSEEHDDGGEPRAGAGALLELVLGCVFRVLARLRVASCGLWAAEAGGATHQLPMLSALLSPPPAGSGMSGGDEGEGGSSMDGSDSDDDGMGSSGDDDEGGDGQVRGLAWAVMLA